MWLRNCTLPATNTWAPATSLSALSKRNLPYKVWSSLRGDWFLKCLGLPKTTFWTQLLGKNFHFLFCTVMIYNEQSFSLNSDLLDRFGRIFYSQETIWLHLIREEVEYLLCSSYMLLVLLIALTLLLCFMLTAHKQASSLLPQWGTASLTIQKFMCSQLIVQIQEANKIQRTIGNLFLLVGWI